MAATAPAPATPQTFLQKAEQVGKSVARDGINIAGTGMGAAVGTLADPFVGPLGTLGGAAAGNWAAQRLNQGLGLQDKTSWGQVAAAPISVMAPGASLAESGIAGTAWGMAKGAASNVAAGAAQKGIDQQEAPTPSELALWAATGAGGTLAGKLADTGTRSLKPAQEIRKMQNSLFDDNLAAAQADGYKFPATYTNPDSVIAQQIEGKAGKADIRRAYNDANQGNTNEIAKDDMGLPANQPITKASWDVAANAPNNVYNNAAAVSPYAEQLLPVIQAARDQEKSIWSDVKNPMATNRTVLRQQAVAQSQEVDAWENELKNELTRQGKPDLYSAYTGARTQLAKNAVYRDAWNPGTGDISAPDIGTQWYNEKPFTGGLAKIGNANLVAEKYTQDAANQLPIGAGKLGGSEGAIIGTMVGGIPGAVIGKFAGAAADAKVSQTMRAIALSDWYQRRMVPANYGAPPPDVIARMLHASVAAAGRQPDISAALTASSPAPSPQALQGIANP